MLIGATRTHPSLKDQAIKVMQNMPTLSSWKNLRSRLNCSSVDTDT